VGHWGSAKNPRRWCCGRFWNVLRPFTYDLVETQQRFNLLPGRCSSSCNPESHIFPASANPVPAGTLVSTQYETTPICARRIRSRRCDFERQVDEVCEIAVTYLNSRAFTSFYNEQSQSVPAGNRHFDRRASFPSQGNVSNISGGTFKQNQLIVNGSVRMERNSPSSAIKLNHANSDTSGVKIVPSKSRLESHGGIIPPATFRLF